MPAGTRPLPVTGQEGRAGSGRVRPVPRGAARAGRMPGLSPSPDRVTGTPSENWRPATAAPSSAACPGQIRGPNRQSEMLLEGMAIINNRAITVTCIFLHEFPELRRPPITTEAYPLGPCFPRSQTRPEENHAATISTACQEHSPASRLRPSERGTRARAPGVSAAKTSRRHAHVLKKQPCGSRR